MPRNASLASELVAKLALEVDGIATERTGDTFDIEEREITTGGKGVAAVDKPW